jgi:hypothetical protein
MGFTLLDLINRKPQFFYQKNLRRLGLHMANLYTPKKRANLSPLQRCILTFGEKNGGTVLARDVLIEYYGFVPNRDPSCLNVGALVFNKSDIGFGRYNSASVAVCKAFNRLVKRGFARKIYSGIELIPGKTVG